MSDPVRLRQAGSDELRELLKHVAPPKEMGAGAFARGQRRVARIAVVPLGLTLMFWLKGIALGAGIGVVAAGGFEVAQRVEFRWSDPLEPAGPTRAEVASQPTPTVLAAPASASAFPAVALSSEPATANPANVASGPREASKPRDTQRSAEPLGNALAQEAALLERARGALGASPAQALALTAQHARQFPSGQLALEREIVAIEALENLGRRGEARMRADALLRAAPGTYYEQRIQNLLMPR